MQHYPAKSFLNFKGFQSWINHANVYLFGVILMAIGLPSSKFLMSISSFILLINWLIEGNFKAKFSRFLSDKSALAISSVFLLHLIGLVYTNDIDYGLKDVRIKLPLLLFPLIFSSSIRFSLKQLKLITHFLASSITIVTLLGYLSYFGQLGGMEKSGRDLSLFISHIRLSLLICTMTAALVFFINKVSKKKQILYVIAIINGIFFMFLMQSLTGLVVLAILASVFLITHALRDNRKSFKIAALTLSILIPISIVGFINHQVNRYFTVKDSPLNKLNQLPKYTASGNLYQHNPSNQQLENGYYVWQNISWEEINYQWNVRNEVKFDEKDANGEPIKGTLIRYMTSKGLPKDSAGIAQLDEEDLKRVLSGRTTVVDYRNPIVKRINQVIFEFDVYKNTGNPSGHSVTQRLEFWKTGWEIVKNNAWFGVGTGDVKQAFIQQYEESNSLLTSESRHRSHNQYLTIAIAFGIIGLLWFIFAVFSPLFFVQGIKSNFLFMSFFIIFNLSFLFEDTLETQAGLSFFIFFWCVYLYFLKYKP
jgi:hypothetical protein